MRPPATSTPAIIAPTAQPGLDQVPYAAAFIGALVTRRMVPSLAVGLALLILLALLRRP